MQGEISRVIVHKIASDVKRILETIGQMRYFISEKSTRQPARDIPSCIRNFERTKVILHAHSHALSRYTSIKELTPS